MGEKRWRPSPRLLGAGVTLASASLAFVVGAIIMLLVGASPIEGYRALISGAFGGKQELATTAVRATPLLLVGVGICIAFRAKVINIGGEGQIIAGALLSASTALAFEGLPRIILLPLVLLAGFVGGGIWGGVPGALKGYLGVNEILTTIMLNIVAVQLLNFLLRSTLIDPQEVANGTRIPQTRRLPPHSDLPILFGGTRLHLGVVIAVVVAVAVWVYLWRTSSGYRVRAVGAGPDAARYAGMPVARTTTLALGLSGALCGLAGAILVFGSESHRLVTDGSASGFTGSAGFNGIVAALFSGLHPLLTIPSAFLFGGLLVGANAMQRATQIPAALAIAVNGLVVLFVVSSTSVRQRYTRSLEASREATRSRRASGTSDPSDPSDDRREVVGVSDSIASPKGEFNG